MTNRLIFTADPARGWRPWGILAPVLGIAFVVLGVAIPTFILQHLNLVDAQENPIGLKGFTAFLVAPFSALIVLITGWVRLVERRSLSSAGLTSSRRSQSFSIGTLVGIGMMSAIVAIDWAAGGFSVAGIARAFASPRMLAGIGLLLVGFAVQSSAEEFLFRGWMLSALAFKSGVIPAVLLSSLTFTFLHFERTATLLFSLNVFLFPVFACYWSLRVGSIWGVMGWHTGWNWLLGVGFELPVTGLNTHMPALVARLVPTGPIHLTGGSQGAEASLGCSIVLIVAICFTAVRGKGKGLHAPVQSQS